MVRLAGRDAAFLDLVRRAIFSHPRSPYRRLLGPPTLQGGFPASSLRPPVVLAGPLRRVRVCDLARSILRRAGTAGPPDIMERRGPVNDSR